jgi:hypothetical protein
MGRKEKISSNFLSLYLLYNPGDIDGAASLSSSFYKRTHVTYNSTVILSGGLLF